MVLLGAGTVEVSTLVAVHPDPPRSAAVSTWERLATTPVASSWPSCRIDTAHPVGRPAPSISELAEMRAVARNLEPSSPVLSATTTSCSFSVLEYVPPGRLAKVAIDTAIAYRAEVGPTYSRLRPLGPLSSSKGNLRSLVPALAVPMPPSTPPAPLLLAQLGLRFLAARIPALPHFVPKVPPLCWGEQPLHGCLMRALF